MIVLSKWGKQRLLQAKVDFLNDLTLRLFKNDVLLTATTTVDQLREVEDTEYRATDAYSVRWESAFINAGGIGETHAPVFTFKFSGDPGGETIFGYYFTSDADQGKLVFGENDPNPLVVTAPGMEYRVRPRMLEDVMPTGEVLRRPRRASG
jgi:hypothetical protein